jgi:integrase
MGHSTHVQVVRYPNRATFQLRWTDPVTGRVKTKTTSIPAVESRRGDAERIAGEIQEKLRNDHDVSPSRYGWQTFRERYESEVATGLAVSTRAKIGLVLDRLEKEIKFARLVELDETRISKFVSLLRQAGLRESTIDSYCGHLKAVLNWAEDQKLIRRTPSFPKTPRKRKAKAGTPAKGRPITGEEFERLLAAVPKVVGENDAASWRWYLRGLWWSGLRLAESLELSWDDPSRIYPIGIDGDAAMLSIPAELEKGHQDRLIPLATEFAEMLRAVPEDRRVGPVFPLYGRSVGRGESAKPRRLLAAHRVSELVSEIGETAGVVVHRDPLDPKRVKFASAHDLRRSFGERWADRVEAVILMEMMRHANIQTTLKYYATRNARRSAETIRRAYLAAHPGAVGSKSGSIAPLADPRGESRTPGKHGVDGAGIEPATHGFSVRCSTN